MILEAKNLMRPIFVIGTGRCGLTPLMHLISYHQDLAWLSQYNNQFPNQMFLSYLSRIVEWPIFSSSLKYNLFVPRHIEAFDFWDPLFLGFREPFRDLNKNDVSPSVKNKFINAINNIMYYQGKKEFISEYSGWSRIGFINAIFPEARFIHIVRDGRAVANSYINVKYWRGWGGVYKWRWGVPKNSYMEILNKYNHSFLALAAIEWKTLVNNITSEGESLSNDRYFTIKYEDMVKNPVKVANDCIDFMGLDKCCKKFKKHLSTVKIIDANNSKFRIEAWKDSLSNNQINMLNDILNKELEYFSYN